MNAQVLAALEQAIEPYRREGYVVTSQSGSAITLAARPPKFSYLLFFFLILLFWPLAIVYYYAAGSRGARIVCLRITSGGDIEASGYTLDVAARERRRARWLTWTLISIPLLLLCVLLVLWYVGILR